MIGHCLQILRDRDFNFGGGLVRNDKVRGAVLTMVSFDIIEVQRLGGGTKNVRLKALKTGHLPLFDKATALRLLGPPNEEAKAKAEATAILDFKLMLV